MTRRIVVIGGGVIGTSVAWHLAVAGNVDGLYVASAMNSGGVTYSGYAGQLITDLVTEADPRFDPARYAPTRFGAQARDETWLCETISQVPSSRYRELHD